MNVLQSLGFFLVRDREEIMQVGCQSLDKLALQSYMQSHAWLGTSTGLCACLMARRML